MNNNDRLLEELIKGISHTNDNVSRLADSVNSFIATEAGRTEREKAQDKAQELRTKAQDKINEKNETFKDTYKEPLIRLVRWQNLINKAWVKAALIVLAAASVGFNFLG